MRPLVLALLGAALLPASLSTPGSGGSGADAIADVVRGFKGVMGVSAKNLVTGEEINIDADRRFPTASTIKVAVLREIYHQAAAGTLRLDETLTLREGDKVGGSGTLNGLHDGLPLTIRDLAHLMIVLSDNTATNMLVARVGARSRTRDGRWTTTRSRPARACHSSCTSGSEPGRRTPSCASSQRLRSRPPP